MEAASAEFLDIFAGADEVRVLAVCSWQFAVMFIGWQGYFISIFYEPEVHLSMKPNCSLSPPLADRTLVRSYRYSSVEKPFAH